MSQFIHSFHSKTPQEFDAFAKSHADQIDKTRLLEVMSLIKMNKNYELYEHLLDCYSDILREVTVSRLQLPTVAAHVSHAINHWDDQFLSCLKKLMNVLEKDLNIQSFFGTAITLKSVQGVIFMTSYVDVQAQDNYGLRIASAQKNQEVFDVLYPLSDPQKALDYMKRDTRRYRNNPQHYLDDTQLLRDRIKSEEEKNILENVVQSSFSKTTKKSKI